MDQVNENGEKIECVDPHERKLIIAYLSYALDDVRKFGGIGSQLLQMVIAEIAERPVADNFDRPEQSPPLH